MFAVIEQGGKQHRVEEGSTIVIDRIPSEQNKKFSNKNVLLIVDDKNDVKVGTPYLENVEVVGEVIEEIKDQKINILRFRRRKHSMRRQGHRQRFTKIKINKIKQG